MATGDNLFPTVGVVITTHDRTNVAKACIASLCKNLQYQNLRYIISDDRSQPGHVEALVEEFEKNGVHDVAVCRTSTASWGLGASMNNGLREAFTTGDIVLTTEDDWYLQKPLKLGPFVKLLQIDGNIGGIRFATMIHAITKKSRRYQLFEEVESDGALRTSTFNNQVMLRHKRIYDALGRYRENCTGDVSERDMITRYNMHRPYLVLWPSYLKKGTLDDRSLYFVHVGKSTQGHSIYKVPERFKWIYGEPASTTPQNTTTTESVEYISNLGPESVTVAMASFPPRRQGTAIVINSIYRQCDQMIVCLNQYRSIPPEFPRAQNIIYIFAGPGQSIPDLGCNNKMRWLGRFPGYYFTVDDDIVYPPDYCWKMVQHMKKFNNSVVMSYEGRHYNIVNGKPLTMDFHKCDVFSYLKHYEGYNLLHRAGGGVMCSYPDKLPFDGTAFTQMPKNSGDDEVMAILCQKYNIKMIRPPSVDRYLNPITEVCNKAALYLNRKGVAERQRFMMSYNKWRNTDMNVDIGIVIYKNLGDRVSKQVVEGISDSKVNAVRIAQSPRPPCISTIGSIMHHTHDGDTVWGTGFISDEQKYNLKGVRRLNALCVRGPLSAQKLRQAGIPCGDIYGDPGIFIPYVFGAERGCEKKYKVGIIPHVEDYPSVCNAFPEDCIVINLGEDPAKCVDEISKCEHIISSSLHGIVIAEALGIPAAWVLFSDKVIGDGFKFRDYALGSGRTLEDISCTDWRQEINLGQEKYLPPARFNVKGMLDSAPFVITPEKKEKILAWFSK